MRKKKLKQKIRTLESRINNLEKPVHEVRVIGFQQLYNLESPNEYDDYETEDTN